MHECSLLLTFTRLSVICGNCAKPECEVFQKHLSQVILRNHFNNRRHFDPSPDALMRQTISVSLFCISMLHLSWLHLIFMHPLQIMTPRWCASLVTVIFFLFVQLYSIIQIWYCFKVKSSRRKEHLGEIYTVSYLHCINFGWMSHQDTE